MSSRAALWAGAFLLAMGENGIWAQEFPPPRSLPPGVNNAQNSQGFTLEVPAPSATAIQEKLPPPKEKEKESPEGMVSMPSYGCCGHGCVPGRLNDCSCCDHSRPLGRMLCGFYESICCPDPCFEPKWIAAANNAFFQDGPKPVTQTRIRYDAGFNYRHPDTSEFFWAKIGGKGPKNPETGVRYDTLSLYNEVAAGKASIFTDIPYTTVDPERNPIGAGFGDFKVGTKALLFDSELFMLTFQFQTILPVGNFRKGLGTGHVSLEPSLLSALKLTRNTYLQAQLAQWIPIAGTQGFDGSVLHYHFSLNQVLWRIMPDVVLIGNAELNGFAYQDGQYTEFVPGVANGIVLGASGNTYFNAGPALRLVICDKVDFGFGAVFGFGNSNGPDQLYRTEFRMRF